MQNKMDRPSPVTTLVWMVLCLTAWNAIRLFAAVADWNLLAEFAPRPGPLYISLSAAFWTLGGVAAWRAIRRPSRRARLAAALYLSGYTLWWWADRLLLQVPRPNRPFALAATVVLLALAASLIFNRKTIAYFQQRETHDQTHTDQDPA